MKILVADDCSVTRRVLKKALTEWGYDVVMASDGAAALAMLEADDAPRMAVLDWMMPEADGPTVCRALRRRETGPYTYVMILTARRDREDLIEALDSGADDFVTKPFHPEEMQQRIRAGRRILNLQDRLLAIQEDLQIQATHDWLTGLWNRAAIMNFLHNELGRGARHAASTSVIVVDVDHFKQFNDSHGHLAGDVVLRETADVLRSGLRDYDMIGRYGGEEFLIVLPETEIAGARAVAERLRKRVAEHAVHVNEQLFRVTVSLGLAVSGTERATDQALIQAADMALYEAKAAGRNRIASAAGAEPFLAGVTCGAALSKATSRC